MPVCFAELHQEVTIRQITGSDKIRAHLENLGFVVGEKIMVIQKVNENVIIKIKGVSLAISHELAKRILI